MDIGKIQQDVETALERASQSDDREHAGRVREEGRRLLFLFNGLMQTTKLHAADNEAFNAPSTEMQVVLQSMLELLGAVHIIFVEDQVYVNDIRLRVRHSEQPIINALVAALTDHDIGGFSIHQILEKKVLKDFAQLVVADAALRKPRETLWLQLGEPTGLEFSGPYRFRLTGETLQKKKDQAAAMHRASQVLTEAISGMAADRIPNPLPVRRAVIDMIDDTNKDPSSYLKNQKKMKKGGIGELHMLNVSNLAILLAQRIGLPESSISDLGVAAMMHDMGYLKVDSKLGHTTAGFRQMLKQRGFHEAKIKRLLAILEHHDNYSIPGEDSKPSLFARIIRIVDDFDTLTAPRPGQTQRSPATVLAQMWGRCGEFYDPDLLAVFVRLLGRYPPGTLVALEDGRWAVVNGFCQDEAHFELPSVQIIRQADSSETLVGGVLDLYELQGELKIAYVIEDENSSSKAEA